MKSLVTFLSAWLGIWEGQLHTHTGTVAGMHLQICPLSSTALSWRMQYEGQPPRAYKLRQDASGQLILDEGQNTNLLTHFVPSLARLVSQFQVEGQLLTTIYALQDPAHLRFELVSHFTAEGLPNSAVPSYPLSSYQTALLKKSPTRGCLP